jgi:DNA-directed RNA polymerase specialized sigma24 family protein
VILADALERLPNDYRQVILLHQVQGLNMNEVSRQSGTSRCKVEKL